MELKEITDIIANNGIGLVCLAVMIYSYVTTMNKINDTLSSIEKTQIFILSGEHTSGHQTVFCL